MHRTTIVSLSTLLLAAAAVAPVAAQEASPDRLELPDGWAPEGITTDGSMLYAGSLADGAIWRADPATGEGSVLVPGQEGMVTAGIEYDSSGRLWAAGANSGEVRVYDSSSGELLATYAFDAGFLNDVTATPEAVYVTDSFVPQLLVIPLAEDGSLPGPDETAVLPLSGDLVYGEGFNANGIVAVADSLIVVHSDEGALYRVDPATGGTGHIDTGDAELTAGDGLEIDGQTLYVVRNRLNQVAVIELDEAAASGSLTAELSSDDLDVPTTVALVGDSLWAVNARFGTDATPETTYWISRLGLAPASDA